MNSTDYVIEEPKGGKGLAIASMICGIISFACCCLDVFSLLVSIAALILGILSLALKKNGKGMAIAGIILGSLGFIVSLSLVIFAYVILPNNPELQQQIQQLFS